MIRIVLMILLIVSGHLAAASAFDDSDNRVLLDVLSAEEDRFVDRADELAEIRNRGMARAWWQSGFVKGKDQWLTYDEAVALAANDQKRLDYETERSAAGDSAEEQLRLASWCGRNELPDQERAHLLAALTADPRLQNERLLRRAGFEPVLGGWISKEQLDRLKIESDRIDDSLNHWQSRLARISRQLRGNRHVKQKALSELREITDPNAVAAIDLIPGRSPRLDTVRVAVQTLGQIEGYQASQVLAKYAVFSDNATIRREATEHLRNRRYEDFVPHMIALMATETRATFTTSRRKFSPFLEPEVAVHLKMERATENQIQIAHSHLRLVPIIVRTLRTISSGLPGYELIPDTEARRVALQFDSNIHKTKRHVDEVNEITSELNGRVSQVLSALTDRRSTTDPNYWWGWWNLQRDVDVGEKTVVEVSEDDVVLTSPHTLRMSCFAKGTLVWTETGLKPIDVIRIGDRVFSKNVESGEVTFSPVLKTTIRKAKPLVVVQLADEEIKATGGHHFWQSGQGWVKARDLRAFGRLHTATGNTFVRDVRSGPSEQTYNLVVEGSHTYFVGKAGMLVQDLLLTPPTNMVVPGLTRFEMQKLAKAE